MLEMVEHRPGRRVVLDATGARPGFIHRLLGVVVGLPLGLIALFLAGVGVTFLFASDSSAWVAIPLFGAAVFIGLLLLSHFLVTGLATGSNCLGLEADARSGLLTLSTAAGWAGLAREVVCPVDEVRRLRLYATNEEDDSPFLGLDVVGWSREGSEVDESLSLSRVEGIENREDALELVRSLGRICGIEGHRTTRDDDEGLVVTLDRAIDPSAEAASASSPSTGAGPGSSGRAPVTPDGVKVPAVDLPPFDPEDYGAWNPHPAEIEWRPGERIHVHIPPASPVGLVVTGGLFGTVAWAMLYLTCLGRLVTWPLASAGLGRLGSTLVGAGIVALAVGWLVRRTQEGGEILLDWEREALVHRRGSDQIARPFEAIRGFAVEGYRRTTRSERGGEDRKSFCDLLVSLPDGRRRLLTTFSRHDRDAVYRQAASLARDLADALDVKWEWRGFEEVPGLFWKLRRE